MVIILDRQTFHNKTDHQSLKYLLENKISTPTQQDWLIKMMGFDYEVRYRKGSANKAVDALSRKSHDTGSVEAETVVSMAISGITTNLLTQIAQLWDTDPKLQTIIQIKQSNSGALPKYTWEHNQLKRKGKLVIGDNPELKNTLLQYFHSSALAGHAGYQPTLSRLNTICYWKAPSGLLQPLPVPTRIWSSIAMDFVEGLPKSQGKEVILVIVDRLSKYGHFIALSHPYSALTVAQAFLDNVFKLHGCPKTFVSDRDKVFLSKFWEELMKKMGVKLTMSTAYHSQIDGQSEVLNRCLETYLRCMCADMPKEWSNWLPLAKFFYNTNFHSSIQTTPYKALYGQKPPIHFPNIPGDFVIEAVDRSLIAREIAIKLLRHHMLRAQDKMRSQANRKRNDKEFKVGTWVYLKLRPYRQLSVARRPFYKLSYRYYSPYQILKCVGQVAYQLALPPTFKIHSTFHISQLKHHTGQIPTSTELPDFDEDRSFVLKPQSILDRKVINRGNKPVTRVLIHWSNTYPEDATWMDFQKFQQQFPTFPVDT
ncbi:Ty3/gypsy retrotransposon protein [Quillaja saponaria]|uniref:Ty3/gypsy retrotransposon protein n=1 Tax=Quillaja saponaria TaxID=32244 RepID=A0AAD7M7S2_QUISA|nr:Ty3/gypsy retrotransposon protein [Quillaja saponaria]